jgi:hypothetical protein
MDTLRERPAFENPSELKFLITGGDYCAIEKASEMLVQGVEDDDTQKLIRLRMAMPKQQLFAIQGATLDQNIRILSNITAALRSENISLNLDLAQQLFDYLSPSDVRTILLQTAHQDDITLNLLERVEQKGKLYPYDRRFTDQALIWVYRYEDGVTIQNSMVLFQILHGLPLRLDWLLAKGKTERKNIPETLNKVIPFLDKILDRPESTLRTQATNILRKLKPIIDYPNDYLKPFSGMKTNYMLGKYDRRIREKFNARLRDNSTPNEERRAIISFFNAS